MRSDRPRGGRWTGRGRDPEAQAGARDVRRFDTALAATVVGLVLLTLASLLPDDHLIVRNGNLDVVLNTLTAIASAAAAALAWGRWRIEGDTAAIYESAAFLVLSVTRALVVGMSTFGPPGEAGLSLANAEQWPLYGLSVARAMTAILLIAAASARIGRRRRPPLPAALVLVAPTGVVLAMLPILRALESALPPMLGAEGFAALNGERLARAGMEPFGLALQGGTALAYLYGAHLYRRVYRVRAARLAGFLAIGLILAAFSQIQWALLPGIYRPLVTGDDILRAGFSFMLLVGIGAQARVDVRALRVASARLHSLREAEDDRSELLARARIAREIHDGLAQELWLVKLKHAEVAAMKNLTKEDSRRVSELGTAVDRALDKGRSVVGELRREPRLRSLREGLLVLAGDHEAAAGVPVAVRWDSRLPDVTTDIAGEALAIVGEALRNAHRHADATRVAVEASLEKGRAKIRITDNGRGFDPNRQGEAFGIRGMNERAALIGGTVEIHSAPSDGTSVEVVFDPAASLGSGGR